MNEFEREAAPRLERNGYLQFNQIEMVSMERDRAEFRMKVRPENRNPYGQLHGGAIYTLADNATGAAAHTDGRYYVTQTSALHFIHNLADGYVKAEAHVRHRGRSTCLTAVDIVAEENGKLIATGEFTFFCVDMGLMEQKRPKDEAGENSEVLKTEN